MKSKYEIVDNKKTGFYQDADLFFTSAGQQRALTAIDQVLQDKIDFLLIAGDEGTGKSRLLDEVLDKVPDTLQLARVSGLHEYPESFLRDVIFAFDQNPVNDDVDALFNELVDYLLGQHQAGARALLIVDDAHELTVDSIDLIQALSELETREESMLKMVLASRKNTPVFNNLERITELPTLRSALVEIDPYTERETREYTLQLLANDPATANLKLTTTGGRRIHYYSGGNPALIAFLSRVAGSITIGSGQSQISRKIVQRAIRSPKWVEISETIPGIHNVKIPGSDERGQHATPKLIAYKEGERLFEYELAGEKIWLGRDPTSSVQLPGASVSRRHALITREGETIWISNLNSINGTQVNSKPVLRRVLLDGDVIRVANYLLLFIYEESAKSSGHLKQVDTASEMAVPAERTGHTDNFIDLPGTANDDYPLDIDYNSEPPLPPDGNRKAVFAIGTIASIALVTAAIMMSKQDNDAEPLATPTPPSVPTNELPQLPQINPPMVYNNDNLPSLPEQETAPAVTGSIMDGRPADLPMPFTVIEDLQQPVQSVASEPVYTESVSQPTTSSYTYGDDRNLSDQVYADNIIDSRIETGSYSPEAGFADLAFGASSSTTSGSYNAPVDSYTSYSRNDAIVVDNSYTSVDVDALLRTANRQLAALKLSVPEGDNAYETFNQVLAADPTNPDALRGIDQIVDRYEQLSRASQSRGNTTNAIRLADRGLALQPWHQGLNTLRAELNNQPRARIARAANPQNRFNIARASESELQSLYNQLPERVAAPASGGTIQPLSDVDRFYPNGQSPASASPRYTTKAIPSDAKPLPFSSSSITRYDPPPSISYGEPVSIGVAPLSSLPTLPMASIVEPQRYTTSAVSGSNAPIARTVPAQPVMAPQPAPVSVAAPVATTQPSPVTPAATVSDSAVTASRATATPVAAPPTAAAPAPVNAAPAPAPVAATPASPIPTYLSSNSGQTYKPSAAPVSAQTIMSVDYLLKQATAQQKAGHYTGPAGNNALETYKRILASEPMNPDAMIGLLDIADYFYRESEKLLLLGDPLSSLAMIEEGLKVRPDHKGLRQLQTNAQLLLEKDGNRTLYGKPMTTQQKKDARVENQIDKIISDATDKLNEEEYSRALSMVEQGLTLDPQNPQLISIRTRALKSLTELEEKWGEQEKLREQNLARQQRVKYEVNQMKAERLLQEARAEYVKGNYQGSMAAISRGLEVMPENIELLALRSEVQKTWDKQTSASANKAVNNIVAGLVAKAAKLRDAGNHAEAMRVIENGLAIEPGNRDLQIMRLEIEKAMQG